MTVALIGEDNPLSDDPANALYNWPRGCAGWRLQRILGLRGQTYLALHRGNLCSPAWDLGRARTRARILLGDGAPWSTVVMLGRRVADAFSWVVDEERRARAGRDLDRLILRPFRWYSLHAMLGCAPSCARDIRLVSIPHPSGRCRAWNDPTSVAKVREVLALAAPEVPWGEHEAGVDG